MKPFLVAVAGACNRIPDANDWITPQLAEWAPSRQAEDWPIGSDTPGKNRVMRLAVVQRCFS